MDENNKIIHNTDNGFQIAVTYPIIFRDTDPISKITYTFSARDESCVHYFDWDRKKLTLYKGGGGRKK